MAEDQSGRNWDKFEEEEVEKTQNGNTWDKAHRVTKAIFAVILFSFVLISAVVSKMAVLILTSNLAVPNNVSVISLKTWNNRLTYETQNVDKILDKQAFVTNISYIWALFIILISSNISTVIYLLWKLSLRRFSNCKINLKHLGLELLISTIHTVGLCLLVFCLIPSIDPLSGVLFCNLFIYLPSLIRFMSILCSKKLVKGPLMVLYFIAVGISIITFILTLVMFCLVRQKEGVRDPGDGQIPLYVFVPIMISVEWIWTLIPEDTVSDDEKAKVARNTMTRSDNQTSKGSVSAVDHDEVKEKWMEKISRLKQELHDERLPIYLIANIWRIVISFCMVMIIFSAGCDEGHDCINSLFGKENRAFLSSNLIGSTLIDSDTYSDPFVIAVIAILASYVCKKACVVAVKICLEVCFVVPLCMSSVVTAILVIILFYRKDNSLVQFGFPSWQGTVDADFHLGHVLCLSLGIPLLCLYCIPIFKNKTERMLSEKRIFFNASYCGILVDQCMILNRWIHQCEIDKEATTGIAQGATIEEGSDIGGTKHENTIPKTVPKVYLCATMWHEESKEMIQLLTSILRLEKDQWKKTSFGIDVSDIIDFEVHVFFDDAFRYDEDGDAKPNEYVADFRKAIKDASTHVYGSKVKLNDPNTCDTPYGQQLRYNLPLGATMVVHLKDKRKIRIKKRWSQVMYMYYLLSYKTPEDLDNVFILALDGDVDFQPSSLYLLSQRMTTNKDVGAVCGRIHAIGSGPMIWYQKFEYAVSHWLQKATEHVTGSILCGPGCFTLFRGSALADMNVAKTYTRKPTEAKHFLQYDLGEDRWLCTLLLKQGKKLEYIAASDSYTFAPEGFKAFFKQRKRWGPSTMANILDLLLDTRIVTKNNSSISKLYMVYQFFLFVTSVLTPGTIFLMILGATKLAYPTINLTFLLVANLVPVVLFVLACLFGKSEFQLKFAAVLSVMYSLIMMIVLVGLLQQGLDKGICSVTIQFTIFVGGVFLTTALLHPKEGTCVIFGLLYFLVTPSMQMLLIIYSIANLNNVSWGTRESPNRSQHSEGTLASVLGFFRRCFKSEKEPTPTTEETQNRNEPHQILYQRETSSITRVKCAYDPSNDVESDRPKNLIDVEVKFWNDLIQEYLQPGETVDPANEQRAKKDLGNLRNKMTLAFLLSNAIFVTVVFYLQKMNEDAGRNFSIQLPCGEGEDVEPIGIAFTFVFGIMLFIQYICMLSHRWTTFLVIMANTSIRKKGNWKVVEDEIDTALREASVTESNNLEKDTMDFIEREKTRFEEEEEVYQKQADKPSVQRIASKGEKYTRPKTGTQRIMEKMKKNSDQKRLISSNTKVCKTFGIEKKPRRSAR